MQKIPEGVRGGSSSSAENRDPGNLLVMRVDVVVATRACRCRVTIVERLQIILVSFVVVFFKK